MSTSAPYRRFADMPELREEIVALLESQGFTVPTPVQAATIPLFCGHKDVAVDALTGSGKTLAFVLPVVERLARLEEKLKKHQVGAIIVSPTRELSKQIFTVAEPFVAVVPGLVVQLLVGGTDPAEDVARLKAEGAHVLVGTPGRIDDVLKRCAGVLDLKAFEVLVLDEADRLLDMGFRVQLDAITARLPKQRRTGLFSATQTEAVQALARAGLRNPVRVKVTTALPADAPKRGAAAFADAPGGTGGTGGTAAAAGSGQEEPQQQQQRTPSGLQIGYCLLTPDEKVPQFVHFLDQHRQHKVIVYLLTCACVDYWALVLRRLPQLKGLAVSALHGRMKQKQREEALQQYSSHAEGVLLCTDVAARGLDIPDVHWILQVDPPQDPAAFVHRVGRTARMGRSGNALVYLHPHEEPYAEFLRLRKVPLTVQEPSVGAPTDVLDFLRKEAETDREVMEKSVHAFVSYVRAYKEHHCKFIFTLQDLDIGLLATSLGLLRLPKMPDIKRARLSTKAFTPSEVDPDTVRFRDKARQKQRDQLLKARAAEALAAPPSAKAKGKAKAAGVPTGVQQREREAAERLPAAKRRKLQERDEVAEMESDYRLLTKLKKGKISQRDYDVATGGEAASDASDDDSSRDDAATTVTAEDQPSQHAGGSSAGGGGSGGQAGTSTSGRAAAVGGKQGGVGGSGGAPGRAGKEDGSGTKGVGKKKKGGTSTTGQPKPSQSGKRGARSAAPSLRPGGALQTYVASQNRRLKRRSGKAAGSGEH